MANNRNSIYRLILINLLIAVGISLIVNFSDFILKLVPAPQIPQMPRGPRSEVWMNRMRNSELLQILHFIYYIVLAFILLMISTVRIKNGGRYVFLKRVGLCVLVTLVIYFLAPRINRQGDIIIMLNAYRFIDSMLITKVAFTLLVALLYGKIYELIYQKQNIQLENEVLKNENLQTTYNTLINQINPHFFFNSLNSLSMLVREKYNNEALEYIDRLSDTFRYVLQNGQTGGTTLEEELQFLEAYIYLLEVRYEGKLFFDIRIDGQYRTWSLPSLVLQPLIENVVKHNTITTNSPITVTITTENDNLVVSNQVNPKMHNGEPSGIGLKNLSHRYRLLTGKDITVTNEEGMFTVVLPLSAPGDTTT